MPVSMRVLIPHNNAGREFCLQFFEGSMCHGGSKATCAHISQLHTWPDELPPVHQEEVCVMQR
ncbi:hypothetical protein PHMEG_00015796 [Phytophthora megakarya]|uniref:Uncharacterized protein n=1 Tax=Phytophthora megakarya TaxID=4795 RepID=A0A225W0U3_9STRA|nr:hypothetical protein PHMEG_00015796 [Phytophthora megakarya]